MANGGAVVIPVVPVASRGAFRAVGVSAGRMAGGGFAGTFKKLVGPALAGFAVGKVLQSAVSLRAEFTKTLNTIGAVTGASAKEMKQLEQTAIDMGNATVFSAKDAADAMLELAKGGISVADIKAGALKGTLLLAAAGGTSLATAAGIASNALNTFGLKGRDMNKVANALAGGANASTASVESLGQALSQVGPGAKNAGLSINETVGALAAFDSAGIKGSDAGTSLKTMLARLVPQTDKAKNAMQDLGLNFVKRNGDFKSITNIAGQLDDKLGGLSQSQKTQALQTIFGSDATRAATVLMNEGSKGLGKYIRATKDQGAAQRAANAAMKGLPGALEKLSGSWETLQLQIGKLIEPAVIAGANFLSKAMGKLPAVAKASVAVFKAMVAGVKEAIGFVKEWAVVIGLAGVVMLGLSFNILKTNIQMAIFIVRSQASALWAGIAGKATKAWALATKILSAAFLSNPIGLVIAAIGLLVIGMVIAYKKSDTFRKIVDKAWAGIKKAVKSAWDGYIKPALAAFTKFLVTKAMPVVRDFWNKGVKPTFKAIGTAIKFAWNNVIKPIFKAWWSYLKNVVFPVLKFLWSNVVKPVFKSVGDGIRDKWNNVIKPIFKALWGYLKDTVFPVLRSLWNDVVKPTMTSVGDKVRDAWKNVIKPAFEAMKSFVTDTLAPKFVNAINTMKAVWTKLSNAAKAPVKFLIETIYNNGLRKMIGAIPGVATPPSVNVPFARGGPVIGGTPGKDSVNAVLMPGEHVLTTAEVKKAGGQKAIYRLRGLIRSGGLGRAGDIGWPAKDELPRFAEGGGFSPEAIAAGQKFAKAQAGKPYVWGGVGPSGYDCSGFMSAIANVLRGGSPYHRLGTSASFPWRGFSPGWGQFTVGAFTGSPGHVAGTLSGMNVESTNGSVRVGSAARGASWGGFTRVAHLGAGGKAAAQQSIWKEFWDAIKEIKKVAGVVKNAIGTLTHMAGPWGSMMGSTARYAGSRVIQYANDKLPDTGPLPNNPIPNVFDSGGDLPPGLSTVFNGTRRVEKVLTDGQWSSIHTLARRGAGRGLDGWRGDIVLPDGTALAAYVDERIDSRFDLSSETARAGRG